MTSPAALKTIDVESSLVRPDTDPRSLEAAYVSDVYHPLRDVRNHYPLLAQQMLTNESLREGLKTMAQDICTSGMYGYKPTEQHLAAVRVVAIKGFAMGMDLPRALETIKVIHGMPTIRGPQALHLIRERTRGATLECTESTTELAQWSLARPGQKPKIFQATRDEVDKAGLPAKNGLWNTYPKRMLKWHAFSEGAQELFGDVLMGCYITEEMDMEANFNRDLDDAAQQSARSRAAPKEKRSGGSARKESEPEQTTVKQETPAETQSQKPKEQGPPKAKPDQLKELGTLLGQLTEFKGGRRVTDQMEEDQKKLVKAEWDNLRQSVFEEVSKKVLDGKVAKSESLTQVEFYKLKKAIEQAIAEAGEP